MCAVSGLTTWCMDFTNAFMHAELKKEDYFFIELPKGYDTKDGSDSVLTLKRALYGSRKSPKLFYNALKTRISVADSSRANRIHAYSSEAT